MPQAHFPTSWYFHQIQFGDHNVTEEREPLWKGLSCFQAHFAEHKAKQPRRSHEQVVKLGPP